MRPEAARSRRVEAIRPVGLSRRDGDLDFPVLLVAKRDDGSPQFVLAILDVRNAKEPWSLREDVPVFSGLLGLLADPATIQRSPLHVGFAATGKPSREFVAAGPDTPGQPIARRSEGYRGAAAWLVHSPPRPVLGTQVPTSPRPEASAQPVP